MIDTISATYKYYASVGPSYNMNMNGKTLVILSVVVSTGLVMSGTGFVLPAFAAGGCQSFFGIKLCGGGSGQGGGSAPDVTLTCTGSPLTCNSGQNFQNSGGGQGQGGGGSGGSGIICTGPNKSPGLVNCQNSH